MNPDASLPWNQALNFPLRPCLMKLTTQWKISNEWRHFRNISKLCVHFAFLTTTLFHQSRFVCFLSRKTTTETTVNWTSIIWQSPTMSWTHSKNQTTFFSCTDSRSSTLGVAEAGTLKLDLRAFKCRNPIFFLEYLFTHNRDTKTAKTLLAV